MLWIRTYPCDLLPWALLCMLCIFLSANGHFTHLPTQFRQIDSGRFAQGQILLSPSTTTFPSSFNTMGCGNDHPGLRREGQLECGVDFFCDDSALVMATCSFLTPGLSSGIPQCIVLNGQLAGQTAEGAECAQWKCTCEGTNRHAN